MIETMPETMSPSCKILALSLLPALALPALSCSASPETLRSPHSLQIHPSTQRLDHPSNQHRESETESETAASSSFSIQEYSGVPDGLSGLARDRDGRLWAVAETSHQLVMLDGRPARTLDIHGVPAGLELESLAFLDDGRLAIGTESEDRDRRSDLILFATRSRDRFVVQGSMEVPYSLWDLHSTSDEGIEAICSTDGLLVVASEKVIEDSAGRAAPLGIYDLARGTWRTARLPLTSDKGKISGLACRAMVGSTGHASDIEFIAIERHFHVRRGLRWTMARDLASATRDQLLTVTPTVFFDISRDSTDNPEGIEWVDDDAGRDDHRSVVAMITDNYFHDQRSGQSKLLMVGQATPVQATASDPR